MSGTTPLNANEIYYRKSHSEVLAARVLGEVDNSLPTPFVLVSHLWKNPVTLLWSEIVVDTMALSEFWDHFEESEI